MMKQKQFAFPLTAVTAAVLSAYAPTYAHADDEITALTKPQSTIAVGAGYLSEDAPRFGIYTGLKNEGAYSLLNVDLIKRDDSTGTWLKFRGNNLGLESRDMRLSHERQGDWAYYLDYSEMPRFEPYTAYTAVRNIGSANLQIPTGAAPAATELPVHMKMKREALGLGYSKILGNGFDLQIRARNEEKNGSRIFSRGSTSPATGVAPQWNFAPEPINSTTRQVDAILGFTTEKLYLAGSYYGTWYDNHNPALNMSGGALSTQPTAAPFNVIALPPGSQSHQLALSGNYNFTPTTKANFKAAYTKATQDDAFVNVGPSPVLPAILASGDLDGRVDTTLLQFGVTSRPLPKLSLLADARYEDRNDKTPIRQYVSNANLAANATFDGYNEPRDIKTAAGKLEASYRLPMEMRVTGGLDYVEKERNTSAIRAVGFRYKTEEISYRLALQRSLAETLTGSVAYVHSDRDGSDFLLNLRRDGTNGVNRVAPMHLADRKRDKLRLSLNWTPVEQLSVQFQTEQARDNYAPRDNRLTTTADTGFEYGLRDGTARNHSIDLSYALTDEWQATAWVSKNDTTAHYGNRNGGGAQTQLWASRLLNNGKSFGLGLRGTPFAKLEVGVDLSHSEIKDRFQQWTVGTNVATAAARATIVDLPSYFNRQSSLKLFGTYALQQNSSIRLDYVFDRYSTNDWTWSSWEYTDGTTLSQDARQNVNFVGITYIYKFH